jgi:hypothetical protein
VADARPIFIVGLPRSGTTLVEQILASHPDVFGAGELPDLPRLIEDQCALQGLVYPRNLMALPPHAFAAIAADYLRELTAKNDSARFVTDKLPSNLLQVGLIRMILPAARIILLRRDPVNLCLSCFSKQFAGELNFTYDLGELGRYVAASLRLMEHWQRILPGEHFMTVQYEDVVADLPGQARRLLQFCDLPWTDRVLAFHQTERVVRTASVNQVRQPIYSSSVGRWRPAAAVLAPLLDGLASLAPPGGARP